MDAVTYLKAKNRMTHNCDMCCEDCPLDAGKDGCIDEVNPEDGVAIVEKWLAEHPPVTYLSKMREVFPDFNGQGACLANIFPGSSKVKCGEQNGCEGCWNREYGSLE